MAVDEYAIGVLAYHLFTGAREFPRKVPLSLTDDMEIYRFLEKTELQFNQPIWSQFRFSNQIKELIRGLLRFDDKDRLKAKEALKYQIFAFKARITTSLMDMVDLCNIEPLSCERLNPVHKSVLYYIA